MHTNEGGNMARLLDQLKRQGYEESYILEDDTLRSTKSGEHLKSDDLCIVGSYRFEGASDPDDMAVVYAVRTNKGKKGTLVDAFGTYATPDLGRFIERIRVDPDPHIRDH